METADSTQTEVISTSRDMSGWLKLVGIVSIVGGAFSIFVTLGFGIIFAWLPIWQGILLVRASNGSKEVSTGNMNSVIDILKPLKIYFIIQGILILIGIFGFIISIFTLGLGGLMDLLKMGGSGIY